MVSYGLLAELTVNGKYGSGDLVPLDDDHINVTVRVLGPHWVQATDVLLFSNGRLIRDEKTMPDARRDLPLGVKWKGQWRIAAPKHDIHLVAIATGPGIAAPYWKTAKPYQPTSPDCVPRVIGCSGAVWLDVDDDGRATPAYDYAQQVFASSRGDLAKMMDGLSDYDHAVSVQLAHLYHSSGKSWFAPAAQEALRHAPEEAQAGVRMYLEAWRANQLARSEK
jgi:hypothetical protein